MDDGNSGSIRLRTLGTSSGQVSQIYTDFVFVGQCGLGRGFLDSSIWESCCQCPLGHQGWLA